MSSAFVEIEPVPSAHFDIILVLCSLDLKTLSLERVEILMRVVPNEKEVKAFREYEHEKKPMEVLSDEDKFMFAVSSARRRDAPIRDLHRARVSLPDKRVPLVELEATDES